MGMDKEALRNTIGMLAESFKELCNFLEDEKLMDAETKDTFFALADRGVERSKWNWAKHELAYQVDFFCEKVRLLADACGIRKQ